MGLHDRCQGGVHTKKRKGIPAIKRRERRSERVHKEIVMKGIYSAVKVTPNGTSILCKKERWKEVNGAGLQVSQQVND